MGRMLADGFRDLVRRAQACDPEAADELFRRVLPFVARAVAGRHAPGESVSDGVQNVCRRILEKLDQFRGADAADDEQAWKLFRAWMRQIVRTVILNGWRDDEEPGKISLTPPDGSGSNIGSQLDPPAPDHTPSSIAHADERHRMILEALNELPDATDREIVWLRFFDGLSLKEIAPRLGLRYDKVRERFYFSLRRLQHRLEGLQ
jgi:RNA polymerase sigma factor (sigma-70 family)